MTGRFSIDTNVAIYAFVDEAVDKTRKVRAYELLEARPYISVQLLNEFANATGKKFRQPWAEIERALALIEALAIGIRPVDLAVHQTARAVLKRYRLSFYDSLMLAAALLDRCEIFYSEDMHHGLVIDERLTVLNPFLAAPEPL